MTSYWIFKTILRLVCGGLSLGLLTLMSGCGKNRHSVEHAEVSGKVLFQGKALPGGQVSFVAIDGGFPAVAVINEDGTYRIKAPIGDVRIGVDNSMLRPPSPQEAGPPQQMKHPSPPGVTEKGQLVKGQWVKIPFEYADPATSGLTYTVTSGSQTHDIELSANPPPPPDPPKW